MTGPMFIVFLALAAVFAVGAWVLIDAAAQRPTGRHRADRRVIEGELVEADTLPIPVGRWQ